MVRARDCDWTAQAITLMLIYVWCALCVQIIGKTKNNKQTPSQANAIKTWRVAWLGFGSGFIVNYLVWVSVCFDSAVVRVKSSQTQWCNCDNILHPIDYFIEYQFICHYILYNMQSSLVHLFILIRYNIHIRKIWARNYYATHNQIHDNDTLYAKMEF